MLVTLGEDHAVTKSGKDLQALWGEILPENIPSLSLEFSSKMSCFQFAFLINGFVQERRNSIANTLELHLTCINPSLYSVLFLLFLLTFFWLIVIAACGLMWLFSPGFLLSFSAYIINWCRVAVSNDNSTLWVPSLFCVSISYLFCSS